MVHRRCVYCKGYMCMIIGMRWSTSLKDETWPCYQAKLERTLVHVFNKISSSVWSPTYLIGWPESYCRNLFWVLDHSTARAEFTPVSSCHVASLILGKFSIPMARYSSRSAKKKCQELFPFGSCSDFFLLQYLGRSHI